MEGGTETSSIQRIIWEQHNDTSKHLIYHHVLLTLLHISLLFVEDYSIVTEITVEQKNKKSTSKMVRLILVVISVRYTRVCLQRGSHSCRTDLAETIILVCMDLLLELVVERKVLRNSEELKGVFERTTTAHW